MPTQYKIAKISAELEKNKSLNDYNLMELHKFSTCVYCFIYI